MTQPYYMIRFSAGCCMFEIKVNDIPVMIMDLPGQAASTVPINFSILKSGKQSITATVLPHSGHATLDDGAMLSFEIKLFEAAGNFNFKEDIISFEFPPVDQQKKLPVLRHRTDFLAHVPYEIEGWQNGLALKEIDDLNTKLRTAYNRLASLINEGKYEQYEQKIAKREHIMTTTMYIGPSLKRKRIDGLIADFKGGFKVMPIPENTVLQLYGDGKVAALKKINGESALYLYNDLTREELMLDLSFYIPNGKNEFEII